MDLDFLHCKEDQNKYTALKNLSIEFISLKEEELERKTKTKLLLPQKYWYQGLKEFHIQTYNDLMPYQLVKAYDDEIIPSKAQPLRV